MNCRHIRERAARLFASATGEQTDTGQGRFPTEEY